MKVLMYGWEFPPIQSGGLGVACRGIVEGLLGHQHEVFLVLPKTSPQMQLNSENFKILSAVDSGGRIDIATIPTGLYSPYASSEASYQTIKQVASASTDEPVSIYGKNMMEEVHRYASSAAVHAKNIPHEVIHTHDWLTVEAGVQAKNISQKPLVMHVHATEFDRSGETPNQHVYDLEKRGMEHSDRVIAVSHYTKKMLMKHYGVPEWKIDVVHNAVAPSKNDQKVHLEKKDKIVLFLGRMTMQKGPDYFLKMAQRVLEHMSNVKFIMAGDGDMMEQVVKMSIKLGIEKNVLFSGFLTGKEIARAYATADLYVMPSVSEPFGIAPLEAIRHGTPVLISKQSGVTEVIKSALRVNFWDVNEMAEKVIAALKYPALLNVLREGSQKELQAMTWHGQAGEIVKTYHRAVSGERRA